MLGVVVHAYNYGGWEAKPGELKAQGQPDYIARPCLNRK